MWRAYRGALERLGSVVLSLVVFGWLATPVHEGFHYLAAKGFDVTARIDLTWGGAGRVVYVDGAPGQPERAVIGLAGGFGTAFVLGLLWLIQHRQLRHTRWELDDAASLLVVVVAQFVYGLFDGLTDFPAAYAMLVAMAAGITVTLAWYGRRLLLWVLDG